MRGARGCSPQYFRKPSFGRGTRASFRGMIRNEQLGQTLRRNAALLRSRLLLAA